MSVQVQRSTDARASAENQERRRVGGHFSPPPGMLEGDVEEEVMRDLEKDVEMERELEELI